MERISLSNAAFEGSNDVYLFADGPETVLIDTGDWAAETREQLEEALGYHGVEFADVDRVLLTHWHRDHSALAGDIQAASGATVHVHARDADLVRGDEAAMKEMRSRQERYFDAWKMPEEKQAVLGSLPKVSDSIEHFPIVEPFEDGDRFSFNGWELEVVHVPGHADGLCLFETNREGRREAFVGDAILPEYTPNIGGADVRVDRPLEKYLEGLWGIIDAEYTRVWPGHRDPIDEPAERANSIIRHHEERAWRVLDVLRRCGPCDTWTVSSELFGELEGIHVLHGPGESYAHLDHLERAGKVTRSGKTYRLADEVPDELAETTDQRWPLTYQ